MSEEFGEDPDMIKSQIMIKVKKDHTWAAEAVFAAVIAGGFWNWLSLSLCGYVGTHKAVYSCLNLIPSSSELVLVQIATCGSFSPLDTFPSSGSLSPCWHGHKAGTPRVFPCDVQAHPG